jgi:tetratricopeptide (TPR) repeat protein
MFHILESGATAPLPRGFNDFSHSGTIQSSSFRHFREDFVKTVTEYDLVPTLLYPPVPMSTMNKKADSFAQPDPAPDTEGLLLERLKNSSTDEDYFRWMLFVVGFYRGINKIDAAVELLEGFINSSKAPEQSAHCHLALGQIATDEQRLDVALKHFATALELAPDKQKIAYVLHNNMGYCLNQLGRFVEGERHCRMAIEIEWTRASAYRNLGVSLQGQGMLVEGAWALVEAIKAESSDSRARDILHKLVAANPQMAVQNPWILQCLHPDSRETPDFPMM